MASHIATDEWQSFELRMRRRRAERMLVRAEAALDGRCLEEAREALDEARRLCPTLPSLNDVDARIASEAARERRAPIVARVRRSLVAAASLAAVAAAVVFGWQAAAIPARPIVTGTALTFPPEHFAATVPSAAAPSQVAATKQPPSSTIRVETEQVPPVVVSGTSTETETEPPPVPPVAPPAVEKPTISAAATPLASPQRDSRAVGTVGPPTPPQPLETAAPAPADVGAIAALGRETPVSAPETPLKASDATGDRPSRARDLPEAVPESSVAPIPHRVDPDLVSMTPAVPKRPDDVALVRSTLDRYADAYTRLDADAAKAVWPTVNRAALSRAFDGLNEQRVAFAKCSVDVRSTQARATCSGSTTWEPKIGGGSRTDVRRWAFDLEKDGDAWIIRNAHVQNR